MTTTADPRWGTLVLEPGFVPFAQGIIAYLAGRLGWTGAYASGQAVDLAAVSEQLSDGADWRAHLKSGGAVVVETPSGIPVRLEPPANSFYTAREPGIYEAHRAGGQGQPLPFAVNVTRTESLLNAASPSDLEQRIVRRSRSVLATKAGAGATDTDPFGAARWLLLLAALALIVESLLAGRISSRRDGFATGGTA